MTDPAEHLGILVIGYLWNHPLGELNELLTAKHPEKVPTELASALGKLTDGDKSALRKALAAIFDESIAHLCTALDVTGKSGQGLHFAPGETPFKSHLSQWRERFAYFDKDGNPKGK